nr:hypothetical protein [Bacteroidales bacterium]
TNNYVSEKSESDAGWLFPDGDEVGSLGYNDMFADMFDSIEQKKLPFETFYDGYVVNAIIDACYRSAASKKWEPVDLKVWRGQTSAGSGKEIKEFDSDHILIKKEVMPDGTIKVMLKEKKSGRIIEKLLS